MNNNENDNIKISDEGNSKVDEQNYTTPDTIFVESFTPTLNDIFICDKYLRNIRDDISELVEDSSSNLDIEEGDMYILTSLVDLYVRDRIMYNVCMNSDEFKHLKKCVNSVLNDIEIKNAIRIYQMLKEQRGLIVMEVLNNASSKWCI